MAVLSLFVTMLLQVLFAAVWFEGDLATPMVLAQAFGIAVAVWVTQKLWPLRKPSTDAQGARTGWVLVALVAGVAAQFPLSALGGAVQLVFPVSEGELKLLYRLIYPTSGLAAALAALGVGCVVPVCEEWFYRHTILRRLHTGERPWQAIFVSALIFGLAHVAPHAIVAAFVAGVVLGWLYLRAGLPAAVAFHMGVNITPFVLRPSWFPIAGFNLMETNEPLSPALWLSGLAFSVASLSLIFRACNKRSVSTHSVNSSEAAATHD